MVATSRIKILIIISITGLFLACSSDGGDGGNGNGSGGGSTSVITSDASACYGAPTDPTSLYLVICYPTPYANVVAATSSVVSGQIIDPTGNPISAGDITSITVNGDAATLDPADPSYWSVTIPTVPGTSTTVNAIANFVVEPDSTVSIVVTNSALISSLIHIVQDPVGNHAYLIDFDSKSVIYQNLATGERRTFSGNGVGTGTLFSNPFSAAVDIARGLLYVSDTGLQKIVKVDLTTGNRLGYISTPAIVSGCVAGDASLELCFPKRILFDSANNRLLIQDSVENAIMAVNVVSGAISLIADATTTGVSSFNGGLGMELDTANNRLLITELNYNALSAINLATGARTIISNNATGTGPAFSASGLGWGVVVDSANNRAIVLDKLAKVLLAVDLITGDRSVISSNATGTGPELLATSTLTGSAGSGQVYVTSSRRVFNINLSSGNRNYVSDTPISGLELFGSFDTAWDYVNQRLLVLGTQGIMSSLYAVELDSGNREIIADQTITPNARQLGTNRTSLATLAGGGTQIVDMLTLQSTDFSAGQNINDRVATIDYANNRTLSYTLVSKDITATDLDTGNKTIVANLTLVTPSLYLVTAMVYDNVNDRLLITATTSGSQVDALYAVDLAGGTVTELSANSTTRISDLSLDLANDRIYALIAVGRSSYLETFNLTNGNRAFVSAPTKVYFESPRGFYVDTEARRAFVADSTLGVVVFDLDTGERALALR